MSAPSGYRELTESVSAGLATLWANKPASVMTNVLPTGLATLPSTTWVALASPTSPL